MALTKEHATSVGLPDDVNHVFTRWETPGEVRPGWRHAVAVLVTPESLMQQSAERRPNKVAFYPPPNPDGAVWFRILIGEPGSELAVTGAVEVGTLRLPSGGMVGVVVHPDPLSPGSAAKVAVLRAEMLATVTTAGARRSTAFAWGHLADGAVLLIDPGPVEPKSVPPDGAEGNAVRGRLTYVRQVDPARPSS